MLRNPAGIRVFIVKKENKITNREQDKNEKYINASGKMTKKFGFDLSNKTNFVYDGDWLLTEKGKYGLIYVEGNSAKNSLKNSYL